MERRSVTKYSVPAALLFLTAIPVIMAAVRSVQIPLGAVPEDTMRLMSTHISFWLHAVAGVSFGLIGPIQFGRVLANRFGRAHKILGRIFVLSGLFLALSGIRLLWSHYGQSTPVLDVTRFVAGVALAIALCWSMYQIWKKNIPNHRAWIIRAYAIGMGSSGVAFIILPIYIVTGEPVNGLASDMVFVVSHVFAILIGELAIRRPALRKPAVQSFQTQSGVNVV